jgi:hypothetical protein
MIEAHSSSASMARVLVQYIADPYEVRRQVRREFLDAPGIEAIRAMRARHLRPGPPPISFKLQEDRYAEFMESANAAFVRALRSARQSTITGATAHG